MLIANECSMNWLFLVNSKYLTDETSISDFTFNFSDTMYLWSIGIEFVLGT